MPPVSTGTAELLLLSSWDRMEVVVVMHVLDALELYANAHDSICNIISQCATAVVCGSLLASYL